MPGYVIHLAIAKKYLQNYKEKNEDEFEKGIISPDLTSDKSKTHYGKSPAYTNLNVFLMENKLDNSFNRGKFSHLVADYLFYNHFLTKISKEILHKDYDRINRELIRKYNVKLLEEIKKQVFFENSKTEILNYNEVCDFIEKVSSLNIDEIAKEVINGDKKWTTYKNLI